MPVLGITFCTCGQGSWYMELGTKATLGHKAGLELFIIPPPNRLEGEFFLFGLKKIPSGNDLGAESMVS